ncbi:uncharacterized protein si:dkey-220k22.3 [Silurus meridionalis]|uniref:THD domain-containing protein n=1 Tax=Silurus meridionalis TaxID=175797 RepID=A0A8T0ABK8_SILME|nr:uncharacterized protein si:dkey-220k22.3 [Silurus meridionalis]KAF7688659.1 hypothetical protein HF521_013466 [Silurus meridionalis]
MAHAARAHVTWISAVIMVAVTVSCVTWIIASRETKPSGQVINGTAVWEILKNPSSTAHCLCKVSNNSATDDHLILVKEWCEKNFSLDENKMWITVEQTGVYLVYVQLTYSLKNDGKSSSVDLSFYVDFRYPEGQEDYSGSFDTRPLSETEQDAHLSSFFLLHIKAKNSLAIKTHQKERIKYNDVQPFSSYITIIRYTDWSG